jgi:hypothetical protein
MGFIHGWGSKKKCLIKKGLQRKILDFHNVSYITTMVYYCVPKQVFKNLIIVGCCIKVLLNP